MDSIGIMSSAVGSNEFQIDINKLQSESKIILNDPDKPLKIEITKFNLSGSEIEFLKENSVSILKSVGWHTCIDSEARMAKHKYVIHELKFRMAP